MRCEIEYLENRLFASSVPPGSQVLIQGPDHMTAGQTVPHIRVEVDSADFQLVKTDNNPIELILDTGLGQTQSLGTATLKIGKAVFRHIHLTQAGGYTLEAITDGATTSPTPFGVMPAPAATATLESSDFDSNSGYVRIDVVVKDKFGNIATNDFSTLFLGPTQPLHAKVVMPSSSPPATPSPTRSSNTAEPKEARHQRLLRLLRRVSRAQQPKRLGEADVHQPPLQAHLVATHPRRNRDLLSAPKMHSKFSTNVTFDPQIK